MPGRNRVSQYGNVKSRQEIAFPGKEMRNPDQKKPIPYFANRWYVASSGLQSHFSIFPPGSFT